MIRAPMTLGNIGGSRFRCGRNNDNTAPNPIEPPRVVPEPQAGRLTPAARWL